MLITRMNEGSVGLKDDSLFRQQCYIAGKWSDADSGDTIPVTNPATGDELGTVPNMGQAETAKAIAAADDAWADWRARPAKERAALLMKWRDLLMENQQDLAMLMTAEQGKPLTESKGEIAYAASFLEWFAEEAKRIYGDIIPTISGDRRLLVLKQPVGVVGAITPWNFPAAMITRKAGPALAAGCPFIVKPATATPYSALALAVLAEKAGIPAGIFSVITGSSSKIGGELTSNPTVRKITFTGSTAVGKKLLEQSAGTVKKVSMELGGNAPFIVFDDADVDAAVEGAMVSKFRNTGQTCVCANRIYVQAGVYDAFSEKLAKAVGDLKVAEGFEDGATQGPLIDMDAVEKVEEHIADAVDKGAKVVAGGKRHALGGTFFEPTLLVNVPQDAKVAKEETFGPMAPIFRFESDEEAIAMANDTEFGLAAYFYSRDIGRIWKAAEALEYGLVGCNSGMISTEVAPFGGFKESGLGREGSKYGIDDYLEIKYVAMAGL